MARTLLLSTLAATVLLAACASRPAPPQRLLALPTPELPAMAATEAGGTPARLLQLGRLEIPEYWQSRAVRYRLGPQDVRAWEDTVWAERVEVGLTRNLTVELSRRLPPGWQLCATQSCGQPGLRPARLLVSLSPMDYDRGTRTLSTWAHWTLADADGTALRQGARTLNVPARPEDGDTPAAQAQALAMLAREVAALIGTSLPAPGEASARRP